MDSLRELNSKLLGKIIELRKENAKIPKLKKKLLKFAKIEAENAKLRQIIKKNAKRDAENAEFKTEVARLNMSKQKSSEDKKMDAFLESEYKRKVSNKIKQCNKKKKLLHELANQNVTFSLSCNTKIITSNQQ
ncbi:hypothetical protein C1645_820799 [Glomus cerebriforme]|uniref:Uncharacterized protein n=1 Tax=Glomus cerebriforme TaxID=658196 RepID=A0A397TBV0_9GLOM|nr:hypothetical protein C1645_820799 [Glomus cerebriforme]